jgi:putative NIF3 family GTP cyclohydrolase 1 type 2
MPMLLLGHYESEVFGVKALMREMSKAFRVKTFFVERETCDE